MATQELSREEILRQVKELLEKELGFTGEITEDASFVEDLDADSLDLLELIMDLEDEFGIKIPDEDREKIVTVGQAVDRIFEYRKVKQAM